MRDVEQPTDQSLESHAKGDVRHTTCSMNVTDELIARFPELTLLPKSFIEHRWVMDLLGYAEQFTTTIARNEIGHHCHTSVVGVDHIGKRLDGAWNADDPKRTIEELGKLFLIRRAECLAEFGVDTLALQIDDCLLVGDTRKR